MIQLRYGFVIAAALTAAAFSQEPLPPLPPPGAGPVVYMRKGVLGGDSDAMFVRAEFGMEAKVVKGAPYSAQAVTEFTQPLADGNRISRTSSSFVARDSEGRTRREQSFAAIGPLSPAGEVPKVVFIHDSVAGTTYVLNPDSKTANLMPEPPKLSPEDMSKVHIQSRQMATAGPVGAESHQIFVTGAVGVEAGVHPDKEANVKKESLVSQAINGVTADGTRITRTIPAGQIGNDRAIEITTETWYSPELQTVVMSKTSDPRTGDTVYKLTNVDRSEPAPSLFIVPGDYTISEAKGFGLTTQHSVSVPE